MTQQVWTLRIAEKYKKPLAHEGPVFDKKRKKLVFTSDRLFKQNGDQYVLISQFDPITGKTTDLGLSQSIPMANGAIQVNPDTIAFTMQGNLKQPAGIALLNLNNNTTRVVIDNANGQPFNSPNDVAIADNGMLIFTDPTYGYEQGFRPQPASGNWVWSVNPDGTKLSVINDDHIKPNGIATDPKSGKVYITDTGYFSGDGSKHPQLPRTIYSYQDVTSGKTIRINNKTLINIASEGIPDGIKVAQDSTIWAATAAGVEVFNPSGNRSQIIPVNGGISNLTFANQKQLYLTGGEHLWSLELHQKGRRNTIVGSQQADVLDGSDHDDQIRGKGGDDIIHPARGNDRIRGGKGRDSFVIAAGKKRILDYEPGETLTIDAAQYGRDLIIAPKGNNLHITSNTGLNIQLIDTPLNEFNSDTAVVFI